MQYAVRMTAKHVHDNQRAEATIHYSEHVIPALSRTDADRMVVALSQNEPSFGTHSSPFDTVFRTYETVGVVYLSSVKGGRKIVLSVGELQMIAEDYTNPMQDAAE